MVNVGQLFRLAVHNREHSCYLYWLKIFIFGWNLLFHCYQFNCKSPSKAFSNFLPLSTVLQHQPECKLILLLPQLDTTLSNVAVAVVGINVALQWLKIALQWLEVDFIFLCYQEVIAVWFLCLLLNLKAYTSQFTLSTTC